MASRRDEIRMTPEEISGLLADELTAQVATIGPNGRPHLVPVFYVPRGAGLATWTYTKSQKVANLRRLPQATVLVETGTVYAELRGVSMECDVEISTDLEEITAIGQELTVRMLAGADDVATSASQFIRAQAAKRVGLVFTPTKVVSWDHLKLGGGY
ncbi:MAG TPA: pyridoxamine 5'-phosphate oxidase family protein [Actinophytocola sp.]|uniref:pyridoxamine 5'-phosphate oxidase family protein n=1 Tax=Actinophytocola sp. TaxID=1872138 RepID=UPI002DBB6EDA|nr:pyridoxamine 5'-phosphate oxidase family protein [Actinophytocola sp.]HEU5472994.1 pyridoxamine 5'-phosphate oxidase family protein [Actinophytocola sp.]